MNFDIDKVTEKVIDEVRVHLLSIAMGQSGWHYVRIWPDGRVSDGVEPSPSYPEREYMHEPGAPVTVWSQTSSGEGLPRDYFIWEPEEDWNQNFREKVLEGIIHDFDINIDESEGDGTVEKVLDKMDRHGIRGLESGIMVGDDYVFLENDKLFRETGELTEDVMDSDMERDLEEAVREYYEELEKEEEEE